MKHKISSDDVEKMIEYLIEKYQAGISFHKSIYIAQKIVGGLHKKSKGGTLELINYLIIKEKKEQSPKFQKCVELK